MNILVALEVICYAVICLGAVVLVSGVIGRINSAGCIGGIIMVVGIIGIMITSTAIYSARSDQNKENSTATISTTLVIDSNAVSSSTGLTSQQTPQSYTVCLPEMSDLTVAGTNAGVVKLENPSANGDVYLQYNVYNQSTGQLLYTTGLVPSGSYVGWVPGDILAAGTYSIHLEENPYVMQDGAYTMLTQGSADFVLTITN